ncbi:MAG: response regulator transcription factor [Actinomycetota bacterium]|nr:response regulator transcription factor [Actinomycetota bacterium]
MTIRILLVDDQPLVRAGLRVILEAEPDMEVIGEAEDGLEAVNLTARLDPHVVVMDIRMPRLDGLEATRRILANAKDDRPRVLVLTTFDVDDYVYEALRAGASGFLLKDAPRADLVAGVRTVAGGDALLAPSVTKRLIQEFAARPARTHRASAALEVLTPREREVLELMARGLSNVEMADKLFVGEATVKSHVGHVLMKLALRDRVQAVIFAYEAGLVTPGA